MNELNQALENIFGTHIVRSQVFKNWIRLELKHFSRAELKALWYTTVFFKDVDKELSDKVKQRIAAELYSRDTARTKYKKPSIRHNKGVNNVRQKRPKTRAVRQTNK